ncbi:unnamed protein product [Cylicocyclus nassatus]|uniref:Uncharacterized protein n=1 Tax=Cylicocyclus nassatus TaxID=53992 RepID=A0AA36HHQ5_CYLNA|nr:unnamed protein product [Cylicocyclus nassatus]
MARMDMCASVTKVRRSIPRILSISKKNAQASTATSHPVIKEEEDSPACVAEHASMACHNSQSMCPAKKEADQEQLIISVDKEVTIEAPNETEETLENEMSKVISVRQVPQMHMAPLTLRNPRPSNNIAEDWDVTKSLTPNELLLALVNHFAPPMEVEETPPLLERELSMDNTFVISNEAVGFENGVAYTSALQEESIPQVPLPTSSARDDHISALPVELPSPPLNRSPQLNSVMPDGTSSKYSPVTLGGAIGIRRPRSSNSQAANNNLTLDQLNPTLAEALAAMKARSNASTKSTGSTVFANGSESYSSRRELLPTRMSGPVTLESLAPVSSASPDGSAVTSSHIVSFNGQTTEVPEEIYCHLCDYPMKLCLRKTKYKGEIREYAAYRCLRKGCQTFRSVRKVIEPDYPYPRKRKIEDSYDTFDACGTLSGSGSGMNSHGSGSRDAEVPTGTLIYVKQEVTSKQMEKMLEFDFKFFDEKPAPMHIIPRLLFGRLNMSVSEMDEHLKTAQGQKEIQHLIMHFRQPSPPPCVIEAAERWEAMAREEQSQVHSGCFVQSTPALTIPASVSPSLPAEPPPKSLLSQALPSYPLLPPPPVSTVSSCCSSSVHPIISYTQSTQSIYDPTTMYEYPVSNQPSRLDSMSSSSCAMASQIHTQDFRNQQCISEIIW